jgi:hypothetical protein
MQMKTLKLITLLTAILWLSISTFAQTQKFDVMTYTPPKGWTAGQNGQAKTFTTVDKAAGKFCMMFLYPSVTVHGTPSQDFAYVWKTIVQEPFKAGANPEKETTEADGFTIIQGGELVEYEGNKVLALLTTVSGKGKVISLLTLMNDAKYATDLQNFLGAMDIDIKETPKAKPSSQSSSQSVSESVSDYEYVVPPKWKAEVFSNLINFRSEFGSVISFNPFIASDGSLEDIVERNFWTIFSGWQPVTDNGYTAAWGEFEKGKTKQGFEYYQVLRYANKNINDTLVYNELILLLVKVGDKVAVISAAQGQTRGLTNALSGLDFMLYDLGFKGATPEPLTLQKELLGSWSTFGSSVGLKYTFLPNGTFSFAGASQFRTSRDSVYDNVTTTSFSSDGTYKLSGNLMTITNKKSGITSQDRIRFYSTKYGKDGWEYKMGKLDQKNGETIVYSKDK